MRSGSTTSTTSTSSACTVSVTSTAAMFSSTARASTLERVNLRWMTMNMMAATMPRQPQRKAHHLSVRMSVERLVTLLQNHVESLEHRVLEEVEVVQEQPDADLREQQQQREGLHCDHRDRVREGYRRVHHVHHHVYHQHHQHHEVHRDPAQHLRVLLHEVLYRPQVAHDLRNYQAPPYNNMHLLRQPHPPLQPQDSASQALYLLLLGSQQAHSLPAQVRQQLQPHLLQALLSFAEHHSGFPRQAHETVLHLMQNQPQLCSQFDKEAGSTPKSEFLLEAKLLCLQSKSKAERSICIDQLVKQVPDQLLPVLIEKCTEPCEIQVDRLRAISCPKTKARVFIALLQDRFAALPLLEQVVELAIQLGLGGLPLLHKIHSLGAYQLVERWQTAVGMTLLQIAEESVKQMFVREKGRVRDWQIQFRNQRRNTKVKGKDVRLQEQQAETVNYQGLSNSELTNLARTVLTMVLESPSSKQVSNFVVKVVSTSMGALSRLWGGVARLLDQLVLKYRQRVQGARLHYYLDQRGLLGSSAQSKAVYRASAEQGLDSIALTLRQGSLQLSSNAPECARAPQPLEGWRAAEQPAV